jgi:hypothetical protein
VKVLDKSNTTPSSESVAAREEYGSKVLILFKPWRTLSDLRDEKESWWDAFLRAERERTLDPAAQGVLENMQGFFTAFCRDEDVPEAEDQWMEDCRTRARIL